MKQMKYLLMALMCLISSSVMADDTPIPVEQLPETAKTFVQTNFKGQKIVYAEKDWNSFECRLADGTKIEFTKKGAWKKIDRKAAAVPEAIVPAAIQEYVKANFPNAFITEWGKDDRRWKAELNSGLDLEFNSKYEFVRIDD